MTYRAEVVAALDPLVDGRVAADRVPPGMAMPYLRLLDEISVTSALQGDASTIAWRPLFQVDLWERQADESAELRDAVVAALDGLRVTDGSHVSVRSWVRVEDPNLDLAHRAFTCALVRVVA